MSGAVPAVPAARAPQHPLHLILSDPANYVEHCLRGERLQSLTGAAIATTVVGSGTFGLVLGSTRSFEQALLAGFKLPLVWLVTLAIALPGLYALTAILGRGITFRSLVTLTLGASARASLVLVALAPLLWLLSDVLDGSGQGYHQLLLVAAAIYALSGLFALGLLLRGLARSGRPWLTLVSFSVLLFVVAGQAAWSLRPFVGRPGQQDVPLFRMPEGMFLQSLSTTSRSARGIYAERGADR